MTPTGPPGFHQVQHGPTSTITNVYVYPFTPSSREASHDGLRVHFAWKRPIISASTRSTHWSKTTSGRPGRRSVSDDRNAPVLCLSRWVLHAALRPLDSESCKVYMIMYVYESRFLNCIRVNDTCAYIYIYTYLTYIYIYTYKSSRV